MKYYPILISLFFLLSCSNQREEEYCTPDSENHSAQTEEKYSLIRDQLYVDSDQNLYLKSRTQEHFETGKWIDVWLKTVHCDSCGTPTKGGWKDVPELKDFVDVNSFHLETTDTVQGADIYADKNHRYFHKWMADGGTISLMK